MPEKQKKIEIRNRENSGLIKEYVSLQKAITPLEIRAKEIESIFKAQANDLKNQYQSVVFACAKESVIVSFSPKFASVAIANLGLDDKQIAKLLASIKVNKNEVIKLFPEKANFFGESGFIAKVYTTG